jgi:hypothetical protein
VGGGPRLRVRGQDAQRRGVLVHRLDEALGQRAMGSPRSLARLMILSSMSVMLRT